MKFDKLIVKCPRKNKDLGIAIWGQFERKEEGHAALHTKHVYKSLGIRTMRRWCRDKQTDLEGRHLHTRSRSQMALPLYKELRQAGRQTDGQISV